MFGYIKIIWKITKGRQMPNEIHIVVHSDQRTLIQVVLVFIYWGH